MVDHIANIRAKLTDAELAFLAQAHGIVFETLQSPLPCQSSMRRALKSSQ